MQDEAFRLGAEFHGVVPMFSVTTVISVITEISINREYSTSNHHGKRGPIPCPQCD
jgi:hypothetical protein